MNKQFRYNTGKTISEDLLIDPILGDIVFLFDYYKIKFC